MLLGSGCASRGGMSRILGGVGGVDEVPSYPFHPLACVDYIFESRSMMELFLKSLCASPSN